jgi:SAM-dependent MidA family methyltransferase
MTPLGVWLREIIAAEGPISVERFMGLCLQHPVHGYYTTRMPFGRAGDFVTAPEISQMFGELVGLWAAQVWRDHGAPSAISLVELGPGRGTMMADILRATRIAPGFHDALAVHLVETSPVLESVQRQALARAGGPTPTWHASLDTLPEGPAIILANEFFDALPVCHYVRGARGWHERQVGLGGDGAFAFGVAPEPVALAGTAGLEWADLDGAPPGAILEIGHAARATTSRLAGRIARQGGALLVCDYGHVESGIGETLQAIEGHAFADPLAAPGRADLTAHVDFALMRQAAEAAGAAVHGPVTQGAWLRRLGIVARAEALKARATTAQARAIEAALDRLAGSEKGMATLFKVLALTKRDAPAPPGFSDPP